MANNRYLSGRRAEWLLKKKLEADGAHVTRSAGSKGKWDLIAVYPGGCCFLIQVKSLKHGVSHEPVRREFEQKSIIESTSYVQMLYVRQDGKWFNYYKKHFPVYVSSIYVTGRQ